MTTLSRFTLTPGLYKIGGAEFLRVLGTALSSETLENFILTKPSPFQGQSNRFEHMEWKAFAEHCSDTGSGLIVNPKEHLSEGLVMEALCQNKASLTALISASQPEDSSDSISVGLYKHYKGMPYAVLGSSKNIENGELAVLYKALYGDFGLWVRPLLMFKETAEFAGKVQPRFRKCETSEAQELLKSLSKF